MNLGQNPDRPDRALLGEVSEDQGPLLRHQLVLLHSEFFQELPAGDRENGPQKAPAEDMGGLISGEAVAALGHVAVTEPPGGGGVAGEGGDHPRTTQASSPVRPCLGSPGIIDLVGSHILRLGPLPELSRCLQLPVVKAEQEHLGELKHCLALSGGQVAEFVLHKVQYTLRRGGVSRRRHE